jgi:uncharacterized membrane protein
MQDGMAKTVIFDINEKIWLQAKAASALKNMSLKDFVASAIQEKIDRENLLPK